MALHHPRIGVQVLPWIFPSTRRGGGWAAHSHPNPYGAATGPLPRSQPAGPGVDRTQGQGTQGSRGLEKGRGHMHAQSCPTLWDPTDCSPLGSSVCGVLQARILEWVAISSSRGSSRPRGRTQISYVFPALTGGFFTTSTTWEACRLSCLPQILFPLSYPLTHTHTHTLRTPTHSLSPQSVKRADVPT